MIYGFLIELDQEVKTSVRMFQVERLDKIWKNAKQSSEAWKVCNFGKSAQVISVIRGRFSPDTVTQCYKQNLKGWPL